MGTDMVKILRKYQLANCFICWQRYVSNQQICREPDVLFHMNSQEICFIIVWHWFQISHHLQIV